MNKIPATSSVYSLSCFCSVPFLIGTRSGLPCPFLKIEKSALILEQKCPNCVHPWVESSFQNVILRVSRRKGSKMFSCRAFFLVYLTKSLSKCPNSNFPCPEKCLVVRLEIDTRQQLDSNDRLQVVVCSQFPINYSNDLPSILPSFNQTFWHIAEGS